MKMESGLLTKKKGKVISQVPNLKSEYLYPKI